MNKERYLNNLAQGKKSLKNDHFSSCSKNDLRKIAAAHFIKSTLVENPRVKFVEKLELKLRQEFRTRFTPEKKVIFLSPFSQNSSFSRLAYSAVVTALLILVIGLGYLNFLPGEAILTKNQLTEKTIIKYEPTKNFESMAPTATDSHSTSAIKETVPTDLMVTSETILDPNHPVNSNQSTTAALKVSYYELQKSISAQEIELTYLKADLVSMEDSLNGMFEEMETDLALMLE